MRQENFVDVKSLFNEFNAIEKSGKENKKLDNRRQIEDIVEQKRLECEIDDFIEI